MKKKCLWVVSELYFPEETSTGYFLTKIAEGLADQFEVHAICSRPTYSERHLVVPWHEFRRGVEIHRMRTTRFDKNSTIGRLANLATFTVATFVFSLFRIGRGDLLLVVTNPPSIPPLVGFVARLKGAKPVLLVHDVYPEVLIATGLIGPDSFAARILGAMISSTYRLFHRVVVLGRDMADVVGQRLPGHLDRIAIIPNWGDVHEVMPYEHQENPFEKTHNADGRTIIQFSGNIGRTHDVEAVLEAAAQLAHEQQIQFQFIGGGGKAALVSEGTKTAGNIRYLPRQPREMLRGMLAGADAVIIAFVDQMLGVSVPSRMYNVMAAGTPIIAMADARSELALVVTEEECGWVLAPGDSENLAKLAAYIATPKGKSDAKSRGARGRQAAIARFSLDAVVSDFDCLFRKLDS